MINRRRVSAFVFLTVLVFSCKKDNHLNNELLQGRWLVVEAYRNEALTKTLENAYFLFEDEHILSTNLLPDAERIGYIISKKSIIHQTPDQVEYQVTKLTADSLSLTTVISNNRFNLILIKAIDL